jgi:3-oxoacyl-[acyl-carrier protein] reductase
MLEGKVAIVTGAGRGLGRSEALHLARLGAAVVVNDYGVSVDGSKEESAAQQVAGEIMAAGGKAVANHADVADWEGSKGLVDQAVSEFGGLDIVVNNAGILRDKMLYNMTEEEWDAVIRIHLKGHFCVSRHATAYWRERSKENEGKPIYGRIVNTSSEAYLFGSPGQPNYSAAKGGIIGLTLSTANSCGRFGVTANVICPRARTKMTENLQGNPFAKPEPSAPTTSRRSSGSSAHPRRRRSPARSSSSTAAWSSSSPAPATSSASTTKAAGRRKDSRRRWGQCLPSARRERASRCRWGGR